MPQQSLLELLQEQAGKNTSLKGTAEDPELESIRQDQAAKYPTSEEQGGKPGSITPVREYGLSRVLTGLEKGIGLDPSKPFLPQAGDFLSRFAPDVPPSTQSVPAQTTEGPSLIDIPTALYNKAVTGPQQMASEDPNEALEGIGQTISGTLPLALAAYSGVKGAARAISPTGIASAAAKAGPIEQTQALRYRNALEGERAILENKLQDAVNKSAGGGSWDVEPRIRNAFKEQIDSARFNANPALVDRLTKVRDNIINEIKQKYGGTYLDSRQALEYKRVLQGRKDINFNSDPHAPALNTAKRGAYNALDNALDNLAPEAKEINSKYSENIQERQAIDNRLDQVSPPMGYRQQFQQAHPSIYAALKGGAKMAGVGAAYEAAKRFGVPLP